MKNLLVCFFVLLLIGVTSCEKETAIYPQDLVGTVWGCPGDGGEMLFTFESKTTVTFGVVVGGENALTASFSYTFEGNKITITPTEGTPLIGYVNGNTMNFTEENLIFVRK